MVNTIKINARTHPAEIIYSGNLITAYIFNDLENVAAGAYVHFDTKDGKTIHFEVIEKRMYDFHSRAKKAFEESGEALIKLITGAGSLQADYDTHGERLVVTARKIGK